MYNEHILEIQIKWNTLSLKGLIFYHSYYTRRSNGILIPVFFFFFFYNLQEQNGLHLIRTSWTGTRIRKRERRIQKRVWRGVLFPVECQIKSFIIKIQTCLKIPKYFECMKFLKLYEKVFFFFAKKVHRYLPFEVPSHYLHRNHVFVLFISRYTDF